MFDIGFEFDFEKENAVDSTTAVNVDLFFNAIRDRNHDLLRKILAMPMVNINVLNAQGQTGLSMAAINDDVETVSILLNHGADPNTQDSVGNTPITAAILRASPDVIHTLLKHKASPNKIIQTGPYQGSNLLSVGLCTADNRLVKKLCKSGATIDSTDKTAALLVAVKTERLDFIKTLWPFLSSDNKVAVITHAIAQNSINILHYALANVTTDERQKTFNTNINGMTPLTFSFYHLHLVCVRLLLQNGCELIEKPIDPKEANTEEEKAKVAMRQANEEAILYRLNNKKFNALLKKYFTDLTKYEKTPTLQEISANVVFKETQRTGKKI